MDPRTHERIAKEVRAVLEDEGTGIRQRIRDVVTEELHRMIREELDRELLFGSSDSPRPASKARTAPALSAPLAGPVPEAGETGPPESAACPEGRYLYGIVRGDAGDGFGPIGIDGEEVYIVWEEGVGAVVHDCPARPYESKDEETVKRWLLTHQEVIDQAWRRCGVVIPTAFDTILAAEAGRTPEATVKSWLREGRDGFSVKLDALTDKAEYGVQVFWNAPAMMQSLARESETVQKMTADLQGKPKGSAYLHRQKLESILKKELETQADHYFREFYQEIRACVTEVKIEKTKKTEDPARQMIMNLSCLLPRKESTVLGQALERIDQMACFFVRYTGPWPPYSFA